jgi:hypothetical protein
MAVTPACHGAGGPFLENKSAVQVPFDLRRKVCVNPINFLGFFCWAIHFPFAYDPEKSLWKNAQELQEIIQITGLI